MYEHGSEDSKRACSNHYVNACVGIELYQYARGN